jgi:sodium/proline symporter
MMFFAMLMVPISGIMLLGGTVPAVSALTSLNAGLLSPFNAADGKPVSLIAIISLMAWGLGYFGQPHIVVRFMAIKSVKQIPRARHIAMTWVVVSLTAAVVVGMVGRVFLAQPLAGAATETVFMVMAGSLFSPFIAGLVLSAILAAIMSTASAQLLVTSSAIAQDLYKALLRPHAGENELVRVGRLSVVVVALIAIAIGTDPDNLVLDLVAYAWAGFGAAFGPALVMSLYWRRMTRNGALASIITGGVTVLVWKQFGWLGLYEIVPGFCFAVIAIVAVSLLDKEPSAEINQEFQRSLQ